MTLRDRYKLRIQCLKDSYKSSSAIGYFPGEDNMAHNDGAMSLVKIANTY